MSHLISRILLAILLFPLAGLVNLIAFATLWRLHNDHDWPRDDENTVFIASGVTWTFLAVYWYLLWRGSVRFNARRIMWTGAAAVGAIAVGFLIGLLVAWAEDDLARFVGCTAASLLWLTATCFIWRESRAERAARLSDAGRETIVCPACGYNLTGLAGTRCPECGKQYTLDELLASQPSKAGAELQST